jgi:hypothetical protein
MNAHRGVPKLRIRLTPPLDVEGIRPHGCRGAAWRRLSCHDTNPGESGQPQCDCTHAINVNGFNVYAVAPRDLRRMDKRALGPSQASCEKAANTSIGGVYLIRFAPGAAGRVARPGLAKKKAAHMDHPVTPASLVNFGEAVNFPLILGLVLIVFGIITLVHALVVSVVRRRREVGLLKALGFVRRQIALSVWWQTTTIALVGIVVGVPIGIGRRSVHLGSLRGQSRRAARSGGSCLVRGGRNAYRRQPSSPSDLPWSLLDRDRRRSFARSKCIFRSISALGDAELTDDTRANDPEIPGPPRQPQETGEKRPGITEREHARNRAGQGTRYEIAL